MKNLISKEEKDRIDAICKEYDISKYIINSDGSVDVNGDVELSHQKLQNLPLKFGKISGNFFCSNNELTSLVGCPHTVGGVFYCYDNQLSTLVGTPASVGDVYNCAANPLISTYCGDIEIALGAGFLCIFRNFPPIFRFKGERHIKLILKYQRYFEIWNNDLSLNEENFMTLLSEIEDGLL